MLLWEEAEPEDGGCYKDHSPVRAALQCSDQCLALQKPLHLSIPPGYATTQLFHLSDPKKILVTVNPHGLKCVSSPKLSAISDHILQLPTSPAWQVATGSISECVITHIKEGD